MSHERRSTSWPTTASTTWRLLDHRIPLARGGTHGLANLALACLPCNHYKADLTEDEYRKRLRHDDDEGAGGSAVTGLA